MSGMSRKCPDCGNSHFVEDRAAGDVICSNCGLVVEAHIIDERSEWRTFSDKDKDTADPNRVGGPTNPLLEGDGLTTVIGRGGDGDRSFALNRLHIRGNNPGKALQTAFREIGDLSERLRLSGDNAKNIACELYKLAHESGKLKGRSTLAICAACMFLACRQNNTPRTFKEITGVMPNNIRKKDISACFKEVMQLAKEKGGVGRDAGAQAAPQHPMDYMRRWVSDLKLGHAVRQALETMALNAKPKDENEHSEVRAWDSRAPKSLAAAILFAITQIIPDKVTVAEVCTVTDVAESTIKAVYKDLYPHLTSLLPPGYNTPEQISRMYRPDSRSTPAPTPPPAMQQQQMKQAVTAADQHAVTQVLQQHLARNLLAQQAQQQALAAALKSEPKIKNELIL